MIQYNVLFMRRKGGNPVMRQVTAHDAAHAALIGYRAAGMPGSIRGVHIKIVSATGGPPPTFFEFAIEGTAVHVTRL